MNLAAVGAFVLLLGAALVVGVLWLASGGAFQKQYNLFSAVANESVAGLNLNAPVKYNGVVVGQVRGIELDAANPERVLLLFAIERGTPIKVDTVAVLTTQGLTGIASVELAGGKPGAALLAPSDRPPYPEIRTIPSLSTRLENLLTTALERLDRTTSSIDALLSEENRAAFGSTLADLAVLSRTLAARRDTIDAGIGSAARTLKQAERASAQVGPVIERIGRSAAAIEALAQQAGEASTRVGEASTRAGEASTRAAGTVAEMGAEVRRFSDDTLPELQRLLGELSTLAASLRRFSEQTERNPSGLLFGGGARPAGPGEAPTGTERPAPDTPTPTGATR